MTEILSWCKIVTKTIGIIVVVGSIVGFFGAFKICLDNENYKHMEYNKIISINYLIEKTVEPAVEQTVEPTDGSEYWTIGCSYRLKPAMFRYVKTYETEVKVWINQKFATKKLATEHFYCMGEENMDMNSWLPLFYPVNGHVFNISLPNNNIDNK